MARNGNRSHRIERFLDETSFRKAFAVSRRRVLASVLLVPAAKRSSTRASATARQSPSNSPHPAISPVNRE